MKNQEMINRIGKTIKKLERIEDCKCCYYNVVISELCLLLGKACCDIFKEDDLVNLEILEKISEKILENYCYYVDTDSVIEYKDTDSVLRYPDENDRWLSRDNIQPEKTDDLHGYVWR